MGPVVLLNFILKCLKVTQQCRAARSAGHAIAVRCCLLPSCTISMEDTWKRPRTGFYYLLPTQASAEVTAKLGLSSPP